MGKDMHCGPIHLLPEKLWVQGVIYLDQETGLYTFHRVITSSIEEIAANLIKSGVKKEEIILFEGIRDQAIAIVKPRNDAIRDAIEKKLALLQSSPPEKIPCSAEA